MSKINVKNSSFNSFVSFLKEEKTYYLEHIIEECDKPENKQKVFSNIKESKELIENNYDIMQLSSPMLSVQAKQGIDDTFEQYKPQYNQTEIRKLMLQDGVLTVATTDLEQRFNNIITSFS